MEGLASITLIPDILARKIAADHRRFTTEGVCPIGIFPLLQMLECNQGRSLQMAIVSPSHPINDRAVRVGSTRRSSRRPAGPPSIACPHCHQRHRVFFSSLHWRKPIHKRIAFMYLRCHACTHHFRSKRIGAAVFAAVAIASFLCAGLLLR